MLLQAVEEKVWHVVVPSDALPGLREQALVGSTVRRPDGLHVRVIAEAPPAAHAEPQPPTLEDAYLYHIAQDGAGTGV
jgi:hypothetical protein